MTTHIQEDKGSQGDENEPRASLELVIKTDISSMPEIVRVVEQVAHTKILYQRVSGGRLRIVTEE